MDKNKLERLIYKYRMQGFNKPKFEYSKIFNCTVMDIEDPCGQWKLIKGNSEYACIIGALKWVKANWKKIQKERSTLEKKYPRRHEYRNQLYRN